MTQAVLIAAIAALAPTLAVVLSWNQSRAKLTRVERQTNGKLTQHEREIADLRAELRRYERTMAAAAAISKPPD